MVDVYLFVGILFIMGATISACVNALIALEYKSDAKRWEELNYYSSSKVARKCDEAKKHARISVWSFFLMTNVLFTWPLLVGYLVYRMVKFGWSE